MPKYGITLGYEADKCSICGKKAEVRYIYDSEEKIVVKVCDKCVNKLASMSIKEALEKHGEKTTREHIDILTKKQMEKAGFELKGKKDKAK